MARIHHATASRAAKLGITLTIREGDIVIATRGKLLLAQGTDPKLVLAEAEAKLKAADAPKAVAVKKKPVKKAAKRAPDEDEEDDEEESHGSVVKQKYREKYQPFNHTNGDELAKRLTDAVSVKVGNSVRIDRQKLRKVALSNEVWDTKYRHLNPGLARMSIGNRLRAKMRKGYNPQGL